MPPPTDSELMRRAQEDAPAGRSAFAQLVRRRSPALLRYLGNLLPRELAEDAAQEVFLAAWQHRRRFDPRRGSLTAWLYTIARNRACNLRRGLTPRAEQMVETTPSEEPGPDRRLSVKEAFAALDRALEALPFDQRSVFVLAEIQGLSMVEIAAVEGLPVGTVKSRLARARRKVKGGLQRMGDMLDG